MQPTGIGVRHRLAGAQESHCHGGSDGLNWRDVVRFRSELRSAMSDVAPQPFDPYHKWLGIPPTERPPTWYRLLGIPLFESDPDVIDAAADQRMTHLRKYQTGVNSAAVATTAQRSGQCTHRPALSGEEGRLRRAVASQDGGGRFPGGNEAGKRARQGGAVDGREAAAQAAQGRGVGPAGPGRGAAPVAAASIPVVMPRPVKPVADSRRPAPRSAPCRLPRQFRLIKLSRRAWSL